MGVTSGRKEWKERVEGKSGGVERIDGKIDTTYEVDLGPKNGL